MEGLKERIGKFQADSAELEHLNGCWDGAVTARRTVDAVTIQWQHLCVLAEDLSRLLTNADAFYRGVKDVSGQDLEFWMSAAVFYAGLDCFAGWLLAAAPCEGVQERRGLV